MDDVQDLAVEFWKKTGENPTHLLISVEQHDELSKQFYPKAKIDEPSMAGGNLAVLHLFPNVVVDVVPVSSRFRAQTYEVKLPKMVRL